MELVSKSTTLCRRRYGRSKRNNQIIRNSRNREGVPGFVVVRYRKYQDATGPVASNRHKQMNDRATSVERDALDPGVTPLMTRHFSAGVTPRAVARPRQ